jgi:tetratricopeptide (TPR) repeat protein
MAPDIRRLSEELARDPSSMVFLPLAEALRQQGQLDVALKIAQRGLERHPRHAGAHDLVARICVDQGDLTRAGDEWEAVLRVSPDHGGALKGLGYVRFQQGRLDEAEQFLAQAASSADGGDMSAALATVRRSSGKVGVEADDVETATATLDPKRLFAEVLIDPGQTALLLDAHGYVLGGMYVDPDGSDVSHEVGAQLSGITDEVRRAMRHLAMGEWRSIMFETEAAVVAMTAAPDDALVVVAASRATPLGLLRRLVARCTERAAGWMTGGMQA